MLQAAYHPSQPAAAVASSVLRAPVAHAAAAIAGRDPDAALLHDASIAGLRAERLRAAVAVALEVGGWQSLPFRELAAVRAGDAVVLADAESYGWEFALQQFLGHVPARRFVVDAASPQKELT